MGSEHNILQAIFDEMQELKRAMANQDERRVSIKEFAKRMNMSEPTLYDRIKKGEIDQPHKDGPRSYYLNSYVNEVVTRHAKTGKVAAQSSGFLTSAKSITLGKVSNIVSNNIIQCYKIYKISIGYA